MFRLASHFFGYLHKQIFLFTSWERIVDIGPWRRRSSNSG